MEAAAIARTALRKQRISITARLMDDRHRSPRELLERKKAQLLAEAAALDRDMAELDRLAAKYNLVVSQVDAEVMAPASVKSDAPVKPLVPAPGLSIAELIGRYREHKDSPYQKVHHKTREHYGQLIKRLHEDCGRCVLSELKAQDIQELHKNWNKGRKQIGHSLITMLRGLVNFGATVLKDGQCERLQVVLHNLRFKVERSERGALTEYHARLVRGIAREWGLHSIAMAQAFQFDCMFKQKDVIGEWVPLTEPGQSDVLSADRTEKWLRGLRWQDIGDDLVLRHVVGSQARDVQIDLKRAPMVMEELRRFEERPKSGPVIVSEYTGRPWHAMEFRRRWRKVANAAGIPKTVKNSDRRAGGEAAVLAPPAVSGIGHSEASMAGSASEDGWGGWKN
jgi:hypothetical protein